MDQKDVLDPDILNRVKQGDTAAFELFLSHFEKRIFAFLYSIVRHKEDSQDLAQETFIRVYKNRASIDNEKNVKSWLYTIATHVAYDWFRKKKHIHELYLIDDDNQPFETIDEHDTYTSIENEDQVKRALDRLKPGYRAIILLYYYEQFSYEEIATQLSLPLNTVKTNMRRAKKRLSEEIKKDEMVAR